MQLLQLQILLSTPDQQATLLQFKLWAASSKWRWIHSLTQQLSLVIANEVQNYKNLQQNKATLISKLGKQSKHACTSWQCTPTRELKLMQHALMQHQDRVLNSLFDHRHSRGALSGFLETTPPWSTTHLFYFMGGLCSRYVHTSEDEYCTIKGIILNHSCHMPIMKYYIILLDDVYIHNYRIFPLLSACAYISTGRKPALNSKVRLTARCA